MREHEMSRWRGLYRFVQMLSIYPQSGRHKKKWKCFKMEGEVTSVKRRLGRTKNRSDQMLQKMNGSDEIVIEITKSKKK